MRLALLFLLVVPLDAGAECSDHELFAKGRLEACTASRCTEITAMPRGATPLEPTPPPRAEWDLRTRKADLVRLDAKQIAILWIDDDSRWTVARIFFPVGASPTVATQKLAICK